MERINQICNCVCPVCGLRPVAAENNPEEVVDFKCVYPEPENNFPFDKRVVVSAKNVPEKYFDESGLNHEVISVNTPDQEKQMKTELNLDTSMEIN